MIISIALGWLLIFSNLPDEGIDFNPRLLQKEVSSIFKNKAYRVTELTDRDSSYYNSISGRFFNVTSTDGEIITVYIGRVNSCRAGGCSSHSDQGNDLLNEYFDYFIIFDSAKKIKAVRVFNYEATHGQEVIIKKWLDQFSEYDGSKPLRAGKEIDTISGATISVNALVADVKEKTSLLNKFIFE